MAIKFKETTPELADEAMSWKAERKSTFGRGGNIESEKKRLKELLEDAQYDDEPVRMKRRR